MCAWEGSVYRGAVMLVEVVLGLHLDLTAGMCLYTSYSSSRYIVHCRLVHSSAAGMKAFEDVPAHPGLNLSNKHTDREERKKESERRQILGK